MAHMIWYSENMKEKTTPFSKAQTEQKYCMQFGADADIYMDKKWWNSDACNANQWDFYNGIADTYIKWCKYQWSLCISNKMS